MSLTRIGAVVRKELLDYRRNRFIVVSMTVYPVLFTALPIASLFAIPAVASSAALTKHVGLSLLYLLLIPVVVPATVSGYAIVGEREQGTLEPLLTTPIRREELVLGKALAALIPALLIAYTVFGAFLASVWLFAHSSIETAVFQSTSVTAQPIFIPLLAIWSIWVGITVSARSSDMRVAQQLTVVGSLPPLALASLMAFGIINPTFTLALIVGLVLVAADIAGWRAASAMVDRERLITGASPSRGAPAEGGSAPSSALPATAGMPAQPGTHGPATLRLTRSGVGIELRRGRFDVIVDGENVGALDRHETVERALQPGTHTLAIRAGRYSSRQRSFNLTDGEVAAFRCHGAMMWPRYVASIAKPDLAISLERD